MKFEANKQNYPSGWDLTPGSSTHISLAEFIRERAQKSYDIISGEFGRWNRVDQLMNLYCRPEERVFYDQYAEFAEAKEKSTRYGTPFNAKAFGRVKTRLRMPVTFMNVQTLLTYFSQAFFRDPFIPLNPQGPDDVVGAKVLEQIITHHFYKNRMLLNVNTFLQDMVKYGHGAMHLHWGPMGIVNKNENVSASSISSEGNSLTNVNVYNFFPDPTVPVTELNRGSVHSWVTCSNIKELRKASKLGGEIFNLDKALTSENQGKAVTFRNNNPFFKGPIYKENDQSVDILWSYAEIVPADFQLRGKDYETWLLGIVGDVIISAKKVESSYKGFPLITGAPLSTGYGLTSPGLADQADQLQELIDFLYTSHVQNVRTTLNGNYVYDPSLIVLADLFSPLPGRFIRLKKKQWGKGIPKEAIHQLTGSDITQNHIGESQYLQKMAQMVMSAPENMQGDVGRKGPRVSSTEVSSARSSSLAKLERLATIIEAQAFSPLGEMMIASIQKNVSSKSYMRIYGESAEEIAKELLGEDFNGQRHILIDPEQLQVGVDVLPQITSLPGSANLDTLTEAFRVIGSSEQLSQQFDMQRMLKFMMREAGFKNLGMFQMKNATPTPDEQLLEEVKKGNLVPAQNGNQQTPSS